MTGKQKDYGFTLLELLVVIAVISTLAVVLVTIINPAEMTRRARDATRISDISTLRRSVDLAMADDQNLLATSGVIDINASTSMTDFAGSGLDISKYLSVAPQDPSYNAAGGGITVIGSGCTKGSTTRDTMNYQFWSDGDTYILRAKLESLINCELVQNDGNSNTTYEVGTEPGLDAI